MKRNQVILIILISVLVGWVFSIFPGRYIAAKISTWPVLNRWRILSPQAPIVITNRETVRVAEGGDVIEALNLVKPKISSVVKESSGEAIISGTAINLTSDGSFVTSSSTFTDPVGTPEYFVLLNDGRSAEVKEMVRDLATGLVFFKADLNGVPTASLAASGDMAVGEKVLFVKNSFKDFSSQVFVTYVSVGQNDLVSLRLSSDYPGRCFGVYAYNVLTSGQALSSAKGEIAGIWNGNQIVCSDVLKRAAALYLESQSKISRPQFGFYYSIVGENESKLGSRPMGARILSVEAAPARLAGLIPSDVITHVDGQPINEASTLEEMLEKYKQGDKLALTVNRNGQVLSLSLIVGELLQ